MLTEILRFLGKFLPMATATFANDIYFGHVAPRQENDIKSNERPSMGMTLRLPFGWGISLRTCFEGEGLAIINSFIATSCLSLSSLSVQSFDANNSDW